VHLIIHLQRFRDGSRRVSQVAEVVGMEGEVITLSDLYTFDHGAGIDRDGRVMGRPRPTGIRPTFSEHLGEQGIALPAEMFGETDLFLAARQ
jgi:pilus assembly protein CpaF